MQDKFSLVVCTYNRTKLTDEFLAHNLSNTGIENPNIELIWIDNGSTDGVESIVEKYKPEIFLRRANDCLSKSKNAAYAVCRGDWVIDLENDFFMPDNWLRDMMEYAKSIPNTGIMATKVGGWDSLLTLEYNTPITNINGKEVLVTRAIGPRIFSKELFKVCGFLTENYGFYGAEDFEITERSAKAGFTNYIIPTIIADHRGIGEWDSGEYREKKNKGLEHPKVGFPEGQIYYNPFVSSK